MSARDPLCYLLDHGPGPCDLCRILAQARAEGQRDERKRSVLLIADAYAKGQADAKGGAE